MDQVFTGLDDYTEPPAQYGVHLTIPMPFGGDQKLLPDRPVQELPQIDLVRAMQPTSRAVVPIMHMPLNEVLRTYQVVIPDIILPDDGIRIDGIGAAPSAPSIPDSSVVVPSTSRAVPIEDALPASAPAVSPQFAPEKSEPVPEEILNSPLNAIDPIYALALYISFALGTMFFLQSEVRYAVLWAVMATVGGLLTLVDTPYQPERIRLSELVWGFGVGFLIGLPLLIIVPQGLATTARQLFPAMTPASIFVFTVFAASTGETLFFRGAVQETRGFAVSVGGAAVSAALIYWPALSSTPLSLVWITIFYTFLAVVYSFIRERYGLASALTCQVVISIMLVALPVLLIPRLP